MMQVAVFNTKAFDREFLEPQFEAVALEPIFFEARLCEETISMAKGFEVVSAFVNDDLNGKVIWGLAGLGCKLVALRCAGFNNVDIEKANDIGIQIVRVPEYSPQAVAEHTFGLILALNRRIHRAHNRVREGNFSLDGLLGFDLARSTIGVVGTGKIGSCVARIASGFGSKVLLHDRHESPELVQYGAYCSLEQLFARSDIVTLHCPLTPETHHLIDGDVISAMQSGVMLINTSRGGLVDTKAIIRGLKSKKIGALGLDVYEEEADLFFVDHSESILQDDTFSRLLTFPNVLITSHQAFFTRDALEEIASTTANSIHLWTKGKTIPTDRLCTCVSHL